MRKRCSIAPGCRSRPEGTKLLNAVAHCCGLGWILAKNGILLNVFPHRCNKSASTRTNLIGRPECSGGFGPVTFEACPPPSLPFTPADSFCRPLDPADSSDNTSSSQLSGKCSPVAALKHSLNLPPFSPRFGGKCLPERQVALPCGHKGGKGERLPAAAAQELSGLNTSVS